MDQKKNNRGKSVFSGWGNIFSPSKKKKEEPRKNTAEGLLEDRYYTSKDLKAISKDPSAGTLVDRWALQRSEDARRKIQGNPSSVDTTMPLPDVVWKDARFSTFIQGKEEKDDESKRLSHLKEIRRTFGEQPLPAKYEHDLSESYYKAAIGNYYRDNEQKVWKAENAFDTDKGFRLHLTGIDTFGHHKGGKDVTLSDISDNFNSMTEEDVKNFHVSASKAEKGREYFNKLHSMLWENTYVDLEGSGVTFRLDGSDYNFHASSLYNSLQEEKPLIRLASSEMFMDHKHVHVDITPENAYRYMNQMKQAENHIWSDFDEIYKYSDAISDALKAMGKSKVGSLPESPIDTAYLPNNQELNVRKYDPLQVENRYCKRFGVDDGKMYGIFDWYGKDAMLYLNAMERHKLLEGLKQRALQLLAYNCQKGFYKNEFSTNTKEGKDLYRLLNQETDHKLDPKIFDDSIKNNTPLVIPREYSDAIEKEYDRLGEKNTKFFVANQGLDYVIADFLPFERTEFKESYHIPGVFDNKEINGIVCDEDKKTAELWRSEGPKDFSYKDINELSFDQRQELCRILSLERIKDFAADLYHDYKREDSQYMVYSGKEAESRKAPFEVVVTSDGKPENTSISVHIYDKTQNKGLNPYEAYTLHDAMFKDSYLMEDAAMGLKKNERMEIPYVNDNGKKDKFAIRKDQNGHLWQEFGDRDAITTDEYDRIYKQLKDGVTKNINAPSQATEEAIKSTVKSTTNQTAVFAAASLFLVKPDDKVVTGYKDKEGNEVTFSKDTNGNVVSSTQSLTEEDYKAILDKRGWKVVNSNHDVQTEKIQESAVQVQPGVLENRKDDGQHDSEAASENDSQRQEIRGDMGYTPEAHMADYRYANLVKVLQKEIPNTGDTITFKGSSNDFMRGVENRFGKMDMVKAIRNDGDSFTLTMDKFVNPNTKETTEVPLVNYSNYGKSYEHLMTSVKAYVDDMNFAARMKKQYMEEPIKAPEGRWHTPEMLQNEVYRHYGRLITEKLNSQMVYDNQPWTSLKTTIPTDLTGKQYEGVTAFMLALQTEKEGYQLPIYANAAYFAGWDAKPERDAIPFTIIDPEGPGGTRELFNIDQTNFREKNPERYETFVGVNKAVLDKQKEEIQNNPFRQSQARPAVAAMEKMLMDGKWLKPVKFDGKVDFPYYLPKEGSIHVAPSTSMYSTQDDYYRDLVKGMVSSLHGKRIDSPLLKDFVREGLVTSLATAMVGQKTRFEVTNPTVSHLWKDNMKSPEFTKEVISEAEKSAKQVMQRSQNYTENVDLDKDLDLDYISVSGSVSDADGNGIVDDQEDMVPEKKEKPSEHESEQHQFHRFR
ncbi:MAG: ArdC-like ssDNA-binding domain-containing protein [Prevotellaceae bacterium]|nr:ArdC-like ssDNA-binding domain-containing protein [Prevotellaceae bacterium]